MANFHFLAGEPNPEYRKGVLKAQLDLYRSHQVLLYDKYPVQVGMLTGLMYRRDIEFFLKEVAFAMEPFTAIEKNKIEEVKGLYVTVTQFVQRRAYVIGTVAALFAVLNPKHEWVYKYHLKYIPEIPRREVYTRLAKGAVIGALTYTSGSWFVPLFVHCTYLTYWPTYKSGSSLSSATGPVPSPPSCSVLPLIDNSSWAAVTPAPARLLPYLGAAGSAHSPLISVR